jgi:hypothetical protein
LTDIALREAQPQEAGYEPLNDAGTVLFFVGRIRDG